MLGDLRVLATRRRASCCSTPSARAAGALRRPAPRPRRLRRRAAQAHARARAAVADRSGRRASGRRAELLARRGARAHRARERGRRRRACRRTDVGVDLICAAEATDAALQRRCSPPGRATARREERRGRARGVRAPALRRRPRRHRHPAGGRAQRARASASRRAATSARRRSPASTTRASRTAICAACGCRRRAEPGAALRLGEREVGRLASVASSPRLGPIGARARAPRGRARRRRSRSARHGVTAEVVELPFG